MKLARSILTMLAGMAVLAAISGAAAPSQNDGTQQQQVLENNMQDMAKQMHEMMNRMSGMMSSMQHGGGMSGGMGMGHMSGNQKCNAGSLMQNMNNMGGNMDHVLQQMRGMMGDRVLMENQSFLERMQQMQQYMGSMMKDLNGMMNTLGQTGGGSGR